MKTSRSKSLAELRPRGPQRDQMSAHVRQPVPDLRLQGPRAIQIVRLERCWRRRGREHLRQLEIHHRVRKRHIRCGGPPPPAALLGFHPGPRRVAVDQDPALDRGRRTISIGERSASSRRTSWTSRPRRSLSLCANVATANAPRSATSRSTSEPADSRPTATDPNSTARRTLGSVRSAQPPEDPQPRQKFM